MTDPQPANPPLVTAAYSPLNPDIAALVSKDPSGGATLVTLSGPMPAPTSQFILRIGSAKGGQVDITSTVVEGTTWTTMAKDFADQINANATLKAVNIACQYSGGPLFGVTHFADNYMVCTALTGTPLIKVYNGSQAWDAGPFLALIRKPGGVPLPGSNVGQLAFCSINSAGNDTQYVLLNSTVLDADVNNLQAMFQILLARTIDGAPLVEEGLSLMADGLRVFGRKVLTE